jgi:hypothetical protein
VDRASDEEETREGATETHETRLHEVWESKRGWHLCQMALLSICFFRGSAFGVSREPAPFF